MQVPEDWRNQITIPLSVPGKVISRIIQNRLKAIDGVLREAQCGFRSGRGCVDQVFCLWALIEKAYKFNSPLYLCFIALTKASDSVNRMALWKVLDQRYKFRQKLIEIMKSFHHNTTSKACAYGCFSESFEICNGARQGDILAPNLFNLYLDAMMSMALDNHPNEGLSILFHLDADLVGNKKMMSHRTRLKDLEYADDMCLVATEKQSLKTLLHSVDQACTEMGLDIDTKKTKMSVLPSQSSVHPTAQPVNLGRDRQPVDVVNEFQYLGL